MVYVKWFCWVGLAFVIMAGTNLTGCEGCQEICTQAQLETSMAYDEWQSAEDAYNTAVSTGADQQTLDLLNDQRMDAQLNHQNSVQSMQLVCGG